MRAALLIACAGLALPAAAQAQLITAYTGDEPPPKNWIIDVTTGDDVAGPLGKSRALASDPATNRIFEIEDRGLGRTSVSLRISTVSPDGTITQGSSREIVDSDGFDIRFIRSLAFGNGTLYAASSGNVRDGIPASVGTIDVETAIYTPLPTSDLVPGTSGFTFDHDRNQLLVGRSVSGAPPEENAIYAFDPVTGESEIVATGMSDFDGLAYGYGRIYADCGAPCGPISVFNRVTGQFEDQLPLPRRFGNGSGGATFLQTLAVAPPLRTSFERQVQITSIDFDRGVLSVTNLSTDAFDLSGWRFCSHDFDQARRYSGTNGLDGITLEPGDVLRVYYNDDAPAGDPLRVNRSQLEGSFALPLDQDAYAVQLFFPGPDGSVSFGDSTDIADHIQWNIDGQGAGSAETRTGQAVSEGLWTAEGDFIATEADSASIRLIDLSGDVPGGPDEYEVLGADCPADLDGDGVLTVFDFLEFQNLFSTGELAADFDGDGALSLFDFLAFQNEFDAGC